MNFNYSLIFTKTLSFHLTLVKLENDLIKDIFIKAFSVRLEGKGIQLILIR